MLCSDFLPDFPRATLSQGNSLILLIMQYHIFTDKEMLKQNKELLELHKRCCKTWLVQHSLKHSKIKKFFIVYDWYIKPDNIGNFFFRPINLFIQALLLGQLDQLSDYINKNGNKKRKRTRKV